MTDHLVETVLAFVRQSESWAIPIAFLVAFGESVCSCRSCGQAGQF